MGRFLILLISTALLWAAADLSQADRDLLQSPKGWEYVDVFDLHNGVQMHHECFEQGHPNPNVCSGTLTLAPDGTFAQIIRIHGQDVNRHGTYQLDDDQITLEDELGTKDGPYQIALNAHDKTLRLTTDQAGVQVGADLRLARH
ncbi:MAG TPA: hypothetical protein VHZ07_16510 [Bryobacteraceae bacterium]|jgi:hypothetical protein|nr:hypothetical protein [Bryobacteraceae bacterium]